MTQPLPLTDIEFLTEFAAYCRGRGDEDYNYTDSDNCALTQFLRDTGREIPLNGFGRPDPQAFGEELHDALLGPDIPWRETFSALADRIDKLIPAAVERVG